MGNNWALLSTQRSEADGTTSFKVRKRKREDSVGDNEVKLDIEKRKRLLSTSSYIYQTLFVLGENADVCIKALDKSWNLHKIYLRQASYFASMFSGSWKETDMNIITLEIPDEKITADALNIAFQSLYTDEVNIPTDCVINVLAAACMLGLDGLTNLSVELIKENLSATTVCDYHDAIEVYCGSRGDGMCCVLWLCRNLLTCQTVDLLQNLSPNLISVVLKSPELCVVQVETDLYYLLKKWLFLKQHADWRGSLKELAAAADAFYKSRGVDTTTDTNHLSPAYLHTAPGEAYASLFLSLRLPYILNDAMSVRIVEQDNIIPKDWLTAAYRDMWLRVLNTQIGSTNASGAEASVQNQFEEQCQRCARVLKTDGSYYWRWTGFNYGLDLLLSYCNRSFMIKRNTYSKPSPGPVSLSSNALIHYRLTVVGSTKTGFAEPAVSSGLKELSLHQDQEVVVLKVPPSLMFPLLVNFGVLIHPQTACAV